MVRSKSEVLCADGYADAGIPYVYEALRKVAGRWMAPDFEALCIRRYMEILHEHCGKMDEPDYVMGSFVPRLSLYLQAGYTIGVDLFFTFETKQTPLTPQAVATTLAQFSDLLNPLTVLYIFLYYDTMFIIMRRIFYA